MKFVEPLHLRLTFLEHCTNISNKKVRVKNNFFYGDDNANLEYMDTESFVNSRIPNTISIIGDLNDNQESFIFDFSNSKIFPETFSEGKETYLVCLGLKNIKLQN